MMSGKTSPLLSTHSFYAESPPKRSRFADSNDIRPAFKHLKDNLIEFDKKLSEPIKNTDLKELQGQEAGVEPENLDRDSPIPLKNLGNTCYENSIIQCLFGLNMFMDSFEQSMSKLKDHTQNDVRYRIAEAFDKLYKSYTQKRIQIENNNNNNSNNNQATLSSNITLSETNNGKQSDSIATISTVTTSTTETLTPSNLTPIALVSSATTPNEQSEIERRLEDLKSAVGERSSQFNSTHQQDASEFFYHVIDSIQEFYQSLDKTKDEDNPVTKAFELELDYLIRCPKCHHRTMSEPEKIRTLPLPLPHVNNESTGNQEEYNHPANDAPTPPNSDLGLDSPASSTTEEHRNGLDEKENQALDDEVVPKDSASGTMSIAKLELADKSEPISTPVQSKHYTLCDALNNYFKDDLLDYSCTQPGCESKQRTRKCLIRKLPQVLFITLARYSYTGKKNLDEIEAPFELSVPFRENKSPSHSPSAHRSLNTDEDDLYQLVAVVCHLGFSLNAGHYTSYVYNQNNDSWYSCDDDSITKVQEDDVKNDVSKTGYCFFYARKSNLNPPKVQLPSAQEQNQQEKQIGNQSTPLEHVKEAINCVTESSIVMTPESSPKSSPTSYTISETVNVHGCHAECANGSNDIDDWS